MAEIRGHGLSGLRFVPAAPATARRVFLFAALGLALMLATGAPTEASAQAEPSATASAPGNTVPETIAMARATWDTGWFQTEVFSLLLEALGYSVGYPETMDNLKFYLAAARGDVDLWVNGWFPSHSVFLQQDSVRGKVQPVGFEVIAGALQGYLVDKRTAEKLNITRLSDLQRPEVAAAFDGNGNGKADLIGCNVGWGCERVVEHHLGVYDLRDTVEHVQGDYSPLMDKTIARYNRGEPILFYTWTPNWTVGKLVPGRDVICLLYTSDAADDN